VKKFKVGEYVICEDQIGRVTAGSVPDDHYYWIEVDGVMQVARDVQKLNIRFKPFEINRNLQVYETRVIKGYEYPIQFMSTDDNFAAFSYCKKGTMFGTMGCKPCVTRDQARDWLELQYATLIAKARGLSGE